MSVAAGIRMPGWIDAYRDVDVAILVDRSGGDETVLLVIRDVRRYTAAAAKLTLVTDQLSRRNRDLSTLYEVSAQLSST